jgi:hypothetical protein
VHELHIESTGYIIAGTQEIFPLETHLNASIAKIGMSRSIGFLRKKYSTKE